MRIPNTYTEQFIGMVSMLLILCTGGCATAYMGQAKVDGTDNYIVVGHDGGPNRAMWVIEGTEEYSVTVEDAQ